MNKLLSVLLLYSLAGCTTIREDGYFKVGVGYKFEEAEIRYDDGATNHPISARFEAGIEKGNIIYGVAHHSQWFSGWPVNKDKEYSRTEVFVDYKFTFKD